MGVFLTFLNHNRRAGNVLVLGIDRSAPHIDGQIGKTSCQSSSARLLGCLGKKDASGTFLPNVDNPIFGSSINGNVLFFAVIVYELHCPSRTAVDQFFQVSPITFIILNLDIYVFVQIGLTQEKLTILPFTHFYPLNISLSVEHFLNKSAVRQV